MPKAPGGVLPRRTADPQECRDIALADGAVVLTQLPEPVAATAGGCAELPVHVWGEQLRGYARPCEISISLLPESAGAAAGRQITFESFQGKAGVDLAEIVRAVNAGELQVSDADQMGTTDYAHTDGWAGEVQQPGVDLRPDFFFLVCEEWDAHGGESFIIDGQAILDTLPPATREALLTIPLPRGSRTPRPFLNRCVTR